METYDKLTVANKTIEWLSEELENVNSSYVLLQIEGAANNILIEALEEELKKQKSIISSMVTAKPNIDNTGIHYVPLTNKNGGSYLGDSLYKGNLPNPNYVVTGTGSADAFTYPATRIVESPYITGAYHSRLPDNATIGTINTNNASLTGTLTTSTTEGTKSPAIPFCDTYNGTSRPNLNY